MFDDQRPRLPLCTPSHADATLQDIARHVLGVHVNYTAGPAGIGGAATGTSSGTSAADFDLPTMKKYIAYARGKCAPRLTADAAAALAAEYVEIRQGSRKTEAQAREARLAGALWGNAGRSHAVHHRRRVNPTASPL